jgi:hypothetical protein
MLMGYDAQEKRTKKKNKDGQLDLLSQAGNKKENNQEKKQRE